MRPDHGSKLEIINNTISKSQIKSKIIAPKVTDGGENLRTSLVTLQKCQCYKIIISKEDANCEYVDVQCD